MLPRIKKGPSGDATPGQITTNSNIANVKLVESIAAFNDFYKRMSEQLQKQSKMRRNSPELETFKQAGEILVEIQQYAQPESLTQQPEWLKQVINCAKRSNNQRT